MKPRLMLAAAGLAVLSAAAIAQAATPAAPEAPAKVRFNPDTNNDGYLSRAEAAAAADQRFKRLDVNGDGKLLPDERPARREKSADAAKPAPAPGAEGKEGGRHHWRGGHRGFGGGFGGGFGFGGPISFEENDSNKDGALSIEEYRASALRFFDAADGNRDGKIKLPEPHKKPG